MYSDQQGRVAMKEVAAQKSRLPEAFWQRLGAIYTPEECVQIANALALTSREPTLRINTLRGTPEETLQALRAEGYDPQPCPGVPLAYTLPGRTEKELAKSPLYKSGAIYLQQLASQIPVLFMELEPGLRVLDAAAAPGSKTSQIAALMESRGEIVANEKDRIRYQRLMHNVELLGCDCVQGRIGDALDLGKAYPPDSFDRILADVPCSAEGRISLAREKSYGYWKENLAARHYKHQREIMRRLVGLLKPGGIMIYSTCTMAPEENEAIVHFLLCNYPELELLPIEPFAPYCRPAVGRFGVTPYRKEVIGALRGIPTALNEGFFVAKFRKKAAIRSVVSC